MTITSQFSRTDVLLATTAVPGTQQGGLRSLLKRKSLQCLFTTHQVLSVDFWACLATGWLQMVPGNAKRPSINQMMNGSKPILTITHGHTPILDMIIVVRAAFFPCLEFLEMFTGSVQQIITPSDSSVDVTLLRRRNFVTAVSITAHFPDSWFQPYYHNLKPLSHKKFSHKKFSRIRSRPV